MIQGQIKTIINKALILLGATLLVTGASAASLVVGLPGTANNAFPFGGGVGGAAATRYQQAYTLQMIFPLLAELC